MSDDETGGPKREPEPNAAIEAPLVSHDSSIGESYQKEGPNQAERFTHAYEKTADATEKISDANERIAAATIEAARAAVESAKANRMMVWVTIGLLIVTCFQAYYTTESLTQSERATGGSAVGCRRLGSW